jgi:uncharacterized membrane protein
MHNREEVNRQSTNRKLRSTGCRSVALAVLLLFPTHAFAVDSALVRSLVVPGLGQVHQGHYARAAVFSGAAVVSAFGLILSQVYYNEAVNKFNAQKRIYASYEKTLSKGGVVSIVDMEGTYREMQSGYNDAENRLVWRNAFLVGFAATYVINVIDVLISKPYDVDKGQRLSVDVGPAGVRITKTFRF